MKVQPIILMPYPGVLQFNCIIVRAWFNKTEATYMESKSCCSGALADCRRVRTCYNQAAAWHSLACSCGLPVTSSNLS